MIPAGCETDILRRLVELPFLDRLELAAVSGRSRGAAYEAIAKLTAWGMVDAIPHASPLIPPVRRYHLTADGLRGLASTQAMSLDELLSSRPVSARWRRVLLERLDAVGGIYRVAAALSDSAHPIRFRWYRAGPADAGILLPGGRCLAVVRQGNTADRATFAKRLWRLSQEARPGAVLLLAPDEVRLRQVEPDAGRPAPAGLPGAGGRRGPRRCRWARLAHALRPRPVEPAGSPGLRASRWGTARPDAAPPRIPSRRLGPGLRRQRCSRLPAARSAEARREARPGPVVRLAPGSNRLTWAS